MPAAKPSSEQAAAFPNHVLFTKMVQSSHEDRRIMIRDPENNVEADYTQLLFDISVCREVLRERLAPDLFDDNGLIHEDKTVYVSILSLINYEFLVAQFSILSIGAAMVQLGKLDLYTSSHP
jgi:hypothetical protein